MTASRRTQRTTTTSTTTGRMPTVTPEVSRTYVWAWLVCVGFAWLALLWLVFAGSWPVANRTAQLGLLAGTVGVGLLTFLPFELQHAVRGLTMRGVLGMSVLTQMLVYVPAPTRSMLELSEVPVYLLAILGGYWLLSSLCMPLLYWAGQRMFVNRARRYDVRRSYRQGAEVALMVVGIFVLFALRALTPMFVVIWVAMIVIAEVIFLSFVEPPVTR